MWNPWHGCTKISAGCQNCYMFREDERYGKDPSIVQKTSNFDLPIRKNKKGEYKLQYDGMEIFTCGTSDFFHEEADKWREEAWSFIRERSDLPFLIITKRIHRFSKCLPVDWGDGYENVIIGCTCENQDRSDYRLPIFLEMPIKHKIIIHEPMLEAINIKEYLDNTKIEMVLCGGESGELARPCNYDWVLDTRLQCIEKDVNFVFRQTGAKFIKDGHLYRVLRKDQLRQAEKAGIDYQSSNIREVKLMKKEDEQYRLDL